MTNANAKSAPEKQDESGPSELNGQCASAHKNIKGKILAHQDHAVVYLFSEERYAVFDLEYLSKRMPRKEPLFIGTKKECGEWATAPDETKRAELAIRARASLQRRIPLPSEGRELEERATEVEKIARKFAIAPGGTQITLFPSGPTNGKFKEL